MACGAALMSVASAAVVSFCRSLVVVVGRYQFNTLRHARYSTMMMVYYFHECKQLAKVTQRSRRRNDGRGGPGALLRLTSSAAATASPSKSKIRRDGTVAPTAGDAISTDSFFSFALRNIRSARNAARATFQSAGASILAQNRVLTAMSPCGGQGSL